MKRGERDVAGADAEHCDSCFARESGRNNGQLHILPSSPKSLEKSLFMVYDIGAKEAGKYISNYTKLLVLY